MKQTIMVDKEDLKTFLAYSDVIRDISHELKFRESDIYVRLLKKSIDLKQILRKYLPLPL